MSQTFAAAQSLASSWEGTIAQFHAALEVLGFELEYRDGERVKDGVYAFHHKGRLTVEHWTDLRDRDWIADVIDILEAFDQNKPLPKINGAQIRLQGSELFFDCPGGKLYARRFA